MSRSCSTSLKQTLSLCSLCNSMSHPLLTAFFPLAWVTDTSSSKTNTDRKWLLSKPFFGWKFLSIPQWLFWYWLSHLGLQITWDVCEAVNHSPHTDYPGLCSGKPFPFSSWKSGKFYETFPELTSFLLLLIF